MLRPITSSANQAAAAGLVKSTMPQSNSPKSTIAVLPSAFVAK